jgi:hypothetical protein
LTVEGRLKKSRRTPAFFSAQFFFDRPKKTVGVFLQLCSSPSFFM